MVEEKVSIGCEEEPCKSESRICRAFHVGLNHQLDLELAKDFYGGLFGWEFENAAPEGSPEPYYIA